MPCGICDGTESGFPEKALGTTFEGVAEVFIVGVGMFTADGYFSIVDAMSLEEEEGGCFCSEGFIWEGSEG